MDRRVRGHVAEQVLLTTQVLDVRTALTAAGEHEGDLDDQLAAVVQRGAARATTKPGRERLDEADAVGEAPKGVQPEMGDDTGIAPFRRTG